MLRSTPGSIVSTTCRAALLALVIISMATSFGGTSIARQGDRAPTPGVANLPAGVEVRYAAAIEIDDGNYQWHLVRSTTSLPGDEPATARRGILIAPTGPVLVSHQDAVVDLVEMGSGLLLDDGEAILPVSFGGEPEDLFFAELLEVPAPADTLATETPDYAPPSTIASGEYVAALIHIPASVDAGTLADAVMAEASSPGLAIVEPEQFGGTPDVEQGARWIVALFAPRVVETATGQGIGTGTGTDDTVPMATPVITDTTPSATGTVTPTSTATTTPTATAAATIEPTLPPITVETPSPTPGGLGSRSDTLEIDSGVPNLTELNRDTDADGLADVLETDAGSDRNDKDTDGDGLQDGPEVDNRCSPLKADTDDDGVSDDGEVLLFKTKCDDLDTDDDSLFDYDEIFVHASDPRLADTDGDGLSDYDEIINYDTGVRVPDSDVDGWNDGYEAQTTGTNPLLKDSDYDCLSDPYESSIGTNPTATDTDGDGTRDGLELTVGVDPLDPDSNNGGIMGDPCDGTTVSR